MKSTTFLRVSGFVWLAPVNIVLAWFFAQTEQPASSDYSLAASATGAASAVLVLPVCAAAASWMGWRVRRAVTSVGGGLRSLPVLVISASWPYILSAVTAICVGMLYQLIRSTGNSLPDLRILALHVLTGIAFSCFGFTVGWFFNPLLASPIAIVSSYLWLALPIALNPLWLRQMTGIWLSCCQNEYDLDDRALIAAALVHVAVILASFAALMWQTDRGVDHRKGYAAVMMTAVVALVATGVSLVRGSGPDPVSPRSTKLSCSGATPQICVWPEHQDILAQLRPHVDLASKRLTEFGINVPSRITEQPSDITGQTVGSFAIKKGESGDDLKRAVLLGLAPDFTKACSAKLENWPVPEQVSELYIQTSAAQMWVLYVARVKDSTQPEAGNDPSFVLARHVMRLPATEQRAWYSRVRAAVQDCAPNKIGTLH